MATVDKFAYPEYYDFPPFFTLQPVRATREKQLVLWKQLILEYHRTHGLPLFQPFSSVLFENVKISRKMAQEGRLAVVEYLIRCGNGSWEDETRTRCRIMWKKPTEWAAEIYDFVCAKQRAMIGNVFTVYELYAGEETLGSSLHGMEPWLLREALKVLESEGKAAIIAGETCEEDGVKFLGTD
ncbi:Vacuolar protein-sorting-associated protein 25, partial [Globisporangium splendens]